MKVSFAWFLALSFQTVFKNESDYDFSMFIKLDESVPEVSNKDGYVANDLKFQTNFTKGLTLLMFI